MKNEKTEFALEQREELLKALKARFEKNMNRHNGLEWARIQVKMEANPEKLWSLNEMERTGGKIGGIYNSEGSELFKYLEQRYFKDKGIIP